MSAYYNENDPAIAAWLAELMARGLIAKGHIDTRSITEVQPSDLHGFTQCHFFAGIGGWSAALRLAGWPDDRHVWSGSAPCQPFSAAGKGKGAADERHLWPAFYRLIRECRPDIVIGEQVDSRDARQWLDGVYTDMEGSGYALGPAVLPAASVSAPHGRHRIYWGAALADAISGRCHRRAGTLSEEAGRRQSADSGPFDAMGNAACDGREVRNDLHRELHRQGLSEGREPDGMEHAASGRADAAEQRGQRMRTESAGYWDDFRIIRCSDGKLRRIPTQPEIFPLAHGSTWKLDRRRSALATLLKGIGNAICVPLAAEFIRAFDGALADLHALRTSETTGV